MKEYKRQKYIQHILLNLPKEPGVYKFKDDSNKIIYVGKAKNLKNRVSSYFQSSRDQTSKTKKMVEQIADIEYITVGSDLEAIMLETNLIKELHPKYNVLMKDDKNYVYIKITVQEDFPRILITRKVEKDKARYFGPKTAKYKVERTLKVLKRIFPYRHCSLAIDYIAPRSDSADPKRRHKVKVTHANIKFPCIDYHIKRCIGPCIGTVDKDEYRAIIDQVIRFLEGKHEDVIEKLKADMDRAAADRK
ncbi:MAG TPA: GIY-YIG nuclease family protein, partial [Candidatus Gracilibacteria bacterium]|nr:GIY-YIG nuclease family protein [Candidatus Gracilibacteria bacterium]